jgi:hypothetical protein
MLRDPRDTITSKHGCEIIQDSSRCGTRILRLSPIAYRAD